MLIQVNFFGGAKKSFGTQSIDFDFDNISINYLLQHLAKKIPDDAELDANNILIAVNGVDSSAIDGKKTILHSGDVISIIPIIHGGSANSFTVLNHNVIICPVSGHKNLDHNFLDSLRSKYSKLTIQAISSKFILNRLHIKKILIISLESKKRKILLSEKLETDILLRFAGTTQISRAISDLGIKTKTDFIIIAIGNKSSLEKLQKQLSDKTDAKILAKSNEAHIRKYFDISKKQLDSVYTKTPLEDILQEKSSILF